MKIGKKIALSWKMIESNSWEFFFQEQLPTAEKLP